MNDMNVCGNHEALIGYLYDEGEPAEREAVAAHLALCASCTEEINALRDTRAHLGAWTPPALPLGFQITRTETETAAARVPLKPRFGAGGWRQPLPAWAQVAAAAVIFAAGMSVNGFRSSDDVPAGVAPAQAPAAVAVTAPADDLAVTRAEFARLESRLRSIENADVQLVSRTGGAVDQDELFARITALEDRVSESDRQNLGRFASLIRAYESNRRDLDASLEATQRVSLMESELEDHRQVLRNAVVPLAVRTSLQTGGR